MHRYRGRADTLLCAVVLLALQALVSEAKAQETQRVQLDARAVARATRSVSRETKEAIDTYLTGSDSAARVALRVLRGDPAAFRFVVAVLPKEPQPDLRRSLIGIIQFRDSSFGPASRNALRDRVVSDPDSVVVSAAINAMRSMALRQTELGSLLSRRIARARAARDTTLLPFLLEAEESFAHVERHVLAPAFMRTPSPPFEAEIVPGAAVRFLAFGDYGTVHRPQYRSHQAALADVMRGYHETHRFSFGLTTGDNFYPTAFPSPTDDGWRTAWQDMYGPLGIPFYISLGNHDWAESAGPLSQYLYATTSKSWRFPAFYYTYTAGPAQFFAINTNALTNRQLAWLRAELARSTAKWKIVYGHFPVFEQTDYSVEQPRRLLLPILKEHGVDMYLAGHHHSMQHWQFDGIDYVVTGAGGAANYSLGDTARASRGRRFVASRPGFADVHVTDTLLTLRFVGIRDVTAAARDGDASHGSGEPIVLYEYVRRKE